MDLKQYALMLVNNGVLDDDSKAVKAAHTVKDNSLAIQEGGEYFRDLRSEVTRLLQRGMKKAERKRLIWVACGCPPVFNMPQAKQYAKAATASGKAYLKRKRGQSGYRERLNNGGLQCSLTRVNSKVAKGAIKSHLI